MGLSENVVYPIVPNGFHDHYPYEKLLFCWGYTPFSDIPIWFSYGFPMVFLWFSYGFPMVFLWLHHTNCQDLIAQPLGQVQ